jgi:DNA helicase-2/ATP-dependent DNA helicase PcrA
LDFDDLIMVTVSLLKLFPSVLEAYQERFKYILVDEYQDTNYAQYELVRTLAGKYRNLCVVGDEDQSIYKFRGADIRNILEFEADYPDCNVVKLEQNYRSTKNILNAANQVMQNNRTRKPKVLWTENEHGDPIIRYQGENEHEEATFVVNEIEQLVERGAYYKDCAVFYRTNAQSRVVEEMFLRYGVPYRIIGGLKFYDRAEIKDVLAYLRVLSNPYDAVSLKRIINVPRRGLGDTTIAKIDSFALRNNIGFYEAISRLHEIHTLSTAAVKNLKKFVAVLDELLGIKEKETVESLTRAMLDATGYLALYESEGTIEATNRAENVKELLGVIKEYEDSRDECSLDEFIEEISLVSDIDNFDDEQDTVTLMTVHNAKGLEFNNVFIVGLEEGVFPHIRSMTDPSEIEEERRLFYVGVTRAMQKLHLCNAWSRNLWGSLNYNSPSRFLSEIPPELMQNSEKVDAKAIPQSQIGEFETGDRVYHQKFGTGRIMSVKEPDQVTVFFAGEGEKTLLLKFAPLEKR